MKVTRARISWQLYWKLSRYATSLHFYSLMTSLSGDWRIRLHMLSSCSLGTGLGRKLPPTPLESRTCSQAIRKVISWFWSFISKVHFFSLLVSGMFYGQIKALWKGKMCKRAWSLSVLPSSPARAVFWNAFVSIIPPGDFLFSSLWRYKDSILLIYSRTISLCSTAEMLPEKRALSLVTSWSHDI